MEFVDSNATYLNISVSNASTLDSFYFYEVEQFTVMWILFIAIVFGNSSVIVVIIFTKSRKSRMNYFIKHLAIADLFVGLIYVLTDIIWRITISWYAGNIACKIIRFVQAVVTYASTYVLVALSIDRYDAIINPMNFRSSWQQAKALIAAAWILSILFSSPILLLYEEKIIQGHFQCWIEFSEPFHWKIYMTLVVLTVFVIPAIIIVICYTFIIVAIWKKSIINVTKRNQDIIISSQGIIPKAKIKTVKITSVIITVFIFCWSPYMIFDLLQVYGLIQHTQTNIAIATFIQSLAPLNSAANPIIYYIFSGHMFRTLWEFPLFLCRQYCSRTQQNRKRIHKNHTNTDSTTLSDVLTYSIRKNQNVLE